MRHISSIKVLHRDIESCAIPKAVILTPSNVGEDFIKHIVNIVSNNIRQVAEEIVKTNLIFSYYLTKDFNYSYSIIDTKISNTRNSIKSKSTVKFQLGEYDAKDELCVHSLVNLLVKSKEEIFKYRNDVKKKIKLVNDILTLTILLGDLLDINIDFKNTEIVFNKDFNIETILGNELLNKKVV